MSRSLLRTALELRNPITRLPPTFLLPLRARWLSSTPQQQLPLEPSAAPTASPSIPPTPPTGPSPSLESPRAQQTSAEISANSAPSSDTAAAASTLKPTKAQPNARTAPSSPPPIPTGPIPEAVKSLLPLLRTQPNHYITVHVHGRPYLVTPGDSIRLPFLMPGVSPGDVLRLNRASVLGSRDLTLRPTQPELRRGAANEPTYIDERLFECRATVLGVESEPMRLKEKTKRRNRKVKTVRSKLRFTVVRISELRIKSPEEVEG